MNARPTALAPVLGVLLILFGIASFGFHVWGNAPLEEPASPGRTPNPSKRPAEAWWWKFTPLIVRLHRFSIPGGIVFVGAGILLVLLPDRLRRE